jgi:secreted PhoX family phosphatase
VLVHDTATDGTVSFSANAAAKARGASPFKRPENAQFLPGSDFNTFFFDPTGDTDARASSQPELAARGSWGSIFRVDFHDRNPIGTISIVVLGDAAHASFDNLAFADERTLLAAEDRGDTLHEQLNVMDSIWAFDVRGGEHRSPRRLLALGRDADATAAVAAGSDGDNEPTGLHVSDGAASIRGLLGRTLDQDRTRWFMTQQHGMNQVWEFVVAEDHGERGEHRK